MFVLIDSQILLRFYAFSKDTLDQLQKLIKLKELENFDLIVTDQIRDEVIRNREAKILEGVNEIDKRIVGESLPPSAKGFPEYNEAKELLASTKAKLRELSEKLKNQGLAGTLSADAVLQDAFSEVVVAAGDQALFEAASRRTMLKNPPGKDGSMGDAINWEYLLRLTPARPVFIISDDSDFQSSIDPDRLHPFLEQEWEKGGTRPSIKLYRTLSTFLQNEKPELAIAQTDEALAAISAFVNSGSFKSTHRAVDALRPYEHFTPEQVGQMLEAATTNSQIALIDSDDDVSELLHRLRAMHGG